MACGVSGGGQPRDHVKPSAVPPCGQHAVPISVAPLPGQGVKSGCCVAPRAGGVGLKRLLKPWPWGLEPTGQGGLEAGWPGPADRMGYVAARWQARLKEGTRVSCPDAHQAGLTFLRGQEGVPGAHKASGLAMHCSWWPQPTCRDLPHPVLPADPGCPTGHSNTAGSPSPLQSWDYSAQPTLPRAHRPLPGQPGGGSLGSRKGPGQIKPSGGTEWTWPQGCLLLQLPSGHSTLTPGSLPSDSDTPSRDEVGPRAPIPRHYMRFSETLPGAWEGNLGVQGCGGPWGARRPRSRCLTHSTLDPAPDLPLVPPPCAWLWQRRSGTHQGLQGCPVLSELTRPHGRASHKEPL